jgi:putative hydrolase of the HAD superfamily
MLYKNIFFDLDQTLWDFETNSRETLLELADKYKFTAIGIDSFDAFLTVYLEINEKMWEQHRKGLVDKHTLRYGRFEQTLKNLILPTNSWHIILPMIIQVPLPIKQICFQMP